MRSNIRKKTALMVAAVLVAASVFCSVKVGAEEKQQKEVTLLFTHDMHSRLDKSWNDDRMVGGIGKIKTVFDRERQNNPATFCVDGGDFSMGTLYQTVFETEAVEVTMMGRVGYDAFTLGNHEFDYRAEGLSNMLDQAEKNEQQAGDYQLPQLLVSNIDWSKNKDEPDVRLKTSMENYGYKEYSVIEHDGVRIGMFGIMGKDSAGCAPESGIVFDDPVETAKRMVAQLKKENVDMIVCLSHSGTWEDAEKSEDETLAKQVPEIDVIVSGHSHTYLDEPIRKKDTIVVSAGSNAENVGKVKLAKNETGRWDVTEYEVIPLSEEVPANKEIQENLNGYKELIYEHYLKRFGYEMEQVLAFNEYEFENSGTLDDKVKEARLGNLIADSFVFSIAEAEGEDSDPIDVSIVPSGVIRDTFYPGEITVSEVFNVSSLGIGKDRLPGYPLITCYLTGKELKTIAEIDASVSPIMDGSQVFASGMIWAYNPNRLFLNRVTDVGLTGEMASKQDVLTYNIYDDIKKIEDGRLYRVAADLYSAQMLSAVEKVSKGLLKITPKDKNGDRITDFENAIVYDKKGMELKAWYALANYIDSFPVNGEGISAMPTRYSQYEGRKILQDTTDIWELLKKPSDVAKIIYAVACVILVLIIMLVIIIYRKIKRRKKNGHSKIQKTGIRG